MAVIKCTLEKNGKLRVLKVIEFQCGDTIELDKPVEVSWRIKKNGPPAIRTFKCMGVQTSISAKGTTLRDIIPIPCPKG